METTVDYSENVLLVESQAIQKLSISFIQQ